jgi:hypothetical protein
MLNIFQLVKVWTWEAQPKYPSDFSSISPMHRTRLGPINWPNQIGRVDKAGKRYEINMRDGYWNTNLKWLVLLYKSTSEVHNHAHGYWGTTSLFPPPTTCQLASKYLCIGSPEEAREKYRVKCPGPYERETRHRHPKS